MMNEEQRVAHLSWRWATSSPPQGMPPSHQSFRHPTSHSVIPPVIPSSLPSFPSSLPSFPSSLPSFHHPSRHPSRHSRHSTTPPVIPVIPPPLPSFPSFHHPSRHSGERRNLRPLPGVVCPRVWRKGTPYAGMCSDRREWGSATSGVARRPELIRCPSESGLRGFPLSPERRHLCKSNSSPAPKLRDDSCILDAASCPDRFAGLPASGELWYTCRRIT